jgi:hypothetical protein
MGTRRLVCGLYTRFQSAFLPAVKPPDGPAVPDDPGVPDDPAIPDSRGALPAGDLP